MILCFVPDSNTIHHFNQNKYDSFLRSIPFHQLPCSHCAHRGCLHRHAYYTRRLYIAEIDSFVIIRVLRVRCTRCGTTHALLPHFVIPYQHIPLIDTQDEQDALKQLQEQFSAQIDQLIQHQVLTADLLEIDAEEEYEPTFGTFSRWGESDILLQQIYRMWEDQDYKSVDYTMDEQTGKITRIEISQQKQMTYTEAQLKELSRQDPPPWDRRRFRRMSSVRRAVDLILRRISFPGCIQPVSADHERSFPAERTRADPSAHLHSGIWRDRVRAEHQDEQAKHKGMRHTLM